MKWPKLVGLLIITLIILFFSYSFLIKHTQTAAIQINTNHQANIYLDNIYLGKSPYTNYQIIKGMHSLKLVPINKDLFTYETIIGLENSFLTVIKWQFANNLAESSGLIYEVKNLKATPSSILEINSIPENTVFNLSQLEKPIYQNITPILIENLEIGNYDFLISLPNYQDIKDSFKISKNQKLILTAKLAKQASQSAQIITTQSLDSQNPNQEASSSNQLKNTQNENNFNSSQSTNLKVNNKKDDLVNRYLIIQKTNFFSNQKEILNIRKEPSTTSEIVGFLEVGTKVLYLNKEKNNFYFIEFEDIKNGWISKNYVSFNTP